MVLDDWYLDIGFGSRVALREIFAILPLKMNAARELYLSYYRDQKTYRATKGRKAKSLLLLNNGWAFVSAYSPEELNERIWEARRMEKALSHAEA